MGVRTEAEVLDGLTSVLGTTEKDHVGARRCTKRELIESDALAASGLDASAGSGSEAQRTDGHFGNLIEAGVVRDSGNNGADLALVGRPGVLICGDADNLAQGDRGAVDAGCAQTTEDGVVELGVGATGEEGVTGDATMSARRMMEVAYGVSNSLFRMLRYGFLLTGAFLWADLWLQTSCQYHPLKTHTENELHALAGCTCTYWWASKSIPMAAVLTSCDVVEVSSCTGRRVREFRLRGGQQNSWHLLRHVPANA